jgi:hypothetical protein
LEIGRFFTFAAAGGNDKAGNRDGGNNRKKKSSVISGFHGMHPFIKILKIHI